MEPKVLLIYPPSQLMSTELARPDGSLGLLYLAGALERAEVEVEVLDASVGTVNDSLEMTFNNRVRQSNGLVRIGMTTNRISEVIARGGYNIVGLHSNFTPQTRIALEVAKVVKAVSGDILVIAGGVNARNLPERFLTGGVDVVYASEGEQTIVKLVRAWEQGRNLEVSGTIVMKDGQIVRHPVQAGDVLTNLDELPFPAWHKLPFEHYDHVDSAGRSFLKSNGRSAPIMTSRGCPFRCAYCHISTEKERESESGGTGMVRFKSVDRVMEEFVRLKSLGVRDVYLEDDSLLAKKSRVREIFTRVRDLGLHIASANGVNLLHFLQRKGRGLIIDEEYLDLLRISGFGYIVFSVESASQRILNKYASGKIDHSKLDVVELVRLAVRARITCPINMMIGFPDETEEEIRASIELGRRLVLAGAPYCSFHIAVPFPGSRLYEIALRGGYLQSVFNTDDFNWGKPIMRNTAVSPERLKELHEWGYGYANTEEYMRIRRGMDVNGAK